MAAESQRSWRLEIAGYLFLGGAGAGWAIAGAVLDWAGYRLPLQAGPAPFGVHLVAFCALGGPVITALGALLLVFHLGRNRRLAYTAGRNPRTSWLARGFWLLSAFIAVGCTQLAIAALAPTWADGHQTTWRALEAATVTLAAGTAVYTGLLLRSMAYIAAWRPWELTAVFVASALSGGVAALVAGAGVAAALGIAAEEAVELATAAGGLDAALLVIEAVLLAAYLGTLLRGGSAGAASARLLLRGRWWPAFWIVVLGIGVAAPLSVDLVPQAHGWSGLVGAALVVLAGGFVLRLLVLSVGSKDEPPLRRLSEWRAAARAAQPGALPRAATSRAGV
jgi:protein NrfD